MSTTTFPEIEIERKLGRYAKTRRVGDFPATPLVIDAWKEAHGLSLARRLGLLDKQDSAYANS
jgi:hypothetical protein